MNLTLSQLQVRRERLVAQAAAQRLLLAHNIKSLRVPLTVVGYGLTALRFALSHPAWLVGGGVMFSALRAGRIGKRLKRGWQAWRIMRNITGP